MLTKAAFLWQKYNKKEIFKTIITVSYFNVFYSTMQFIRLKVSLRNRKFKRTALI